MLFLSAYLACMCLMLFRSFVCVTCGVTCCVRVLFVVRVRILYIYKIKITNSCHEMRSRISSRNSSLQPECDTSTSYAYPPLGLLIVFEKIYKCMIWFVVCLLVCPLCAPILFLFLLSPCLFMSVLCLTGRVCSFFCTNSCPWFWGVSVSIIYVYHYSMVYQYKVCVVCCLLAWGVACFRVGVCCACMAMICVCVFVILHVCVAWVCVTHVFFFRVFHDFWSFLCTAVSSLPWTPPPPPASLIFHLVVFLPFLLFFVFCVPSVKPELYVLH